MTPSELLHQVVRPTLVWMGPQYEGDRAEVMLVAVNRIEDPGCTRCQVSGPARGLWQFELGGVQGVLNSPTTRQAALEFGTRSKVHYGSTAEFLAALQHDDCLACVFARLLLWTDPHPLPDPGQQIDAWNLYRRLWRPGKPRPQGWPYAYRAALNAIRTEPATGELV